MSVFYTVYLVKSSQLEAVAKKFSRMERVEGSEWLVCDYGDRYVDGLFEPDSDFTSQLSRQFGETIFIVTLLVKTPAFRRERLQSLAVAMTPSYH